MNDDPVEGDIFISIDRVKDNASQMNLEFENELLRVISHGILHFLGYKDKTPDQQKEMRTKEDELITILKN
jgi:rRNA maturation RNase YbeY